MKARHGSMMMLAACLGLALFASAAHATTLAAHAADVHKHKHAIHARPHAAGQTAAYHATKPKHGRKGHVQRQHAAADSHGVPPPLPLERYICSMFPCRHNSRSVALCRENAGAMIAAAVASPAGRTCSCVSQGHIYKDDISGCVEGSPVQQQPEKQQSVLVQPAPQTPQPPPPQQQQQNMPVQPAPQAPQQQQQNTTSNGAEEEVVEVEEVEEEEGVPARQPTAQQLLQQPAANGTVPAAGPTGTPGQPPLQQQQQNTTADATAEEVEEVVEIEEEVEVEDEAATGSPLTPQQQQSAAANTSTAAGSSSNSSSAAAPAPTAPAGNGTATPRVLADDEEEVEIEVEVDEDEADTEEVEEVIVEVIEAVVPQPQDGQGAAASEPVRVVHANNSSSSVGIAATGPASVHLLSAGKQRESLSNMRVAASYMQGLVDQAAANMSAAAAAAAANATSPGGPSNARLANPNLRGVSAYDWLLPAQSRASVASLLKQLGRIRARSAARAASKARVAVASTSDTAPDAAAGRPSPAGAKAAAAKPKQQAAFTGPKATKAAPHVSAAPRPKAHAHAAVGSASSGAKAKAGSKAFTGAKTAAVKSAKPTKAAAGGTKSPLAALLPQLELDLAKLEASTSSLASISSSSSSLLKGAKGLRPQMISSSKLQSAASKAASVLVTKAQAVLNSRAKAAQQQQSKAGAADLDVQDDAADEAAAPLRTQAVNSGKVVHIGVPRGAHGPAAPMLRDRRVPAALLQSPVRSRPSGPQHRPPAASRVLGLPSRSVPQPEEEQADELLAADVSEDTIPEEPEAAAAAEGGEDGAVLADDEAAASLQSSAESDELEQAEGTDAAVEASEDAAAAAGNDDDEPGLMAELEEAADQATQLADEAATGLQSVGSHHAKKIVRRAAPPPEEYSSEEGSEEEGAAEGYEGQGGAAAGDGSEEEEEEQQQRAVQRGTRRTVRKWRAPGKALMIVTNTARQKAGSVTMCHVSAGEPERCAISMLPMYKINGKNQYPQPTGVAAMRDKLGKLTVWIADGARSPALICGTSGLQLTDCQEATYAGYTDAGIEARNILVTPDNIAFVLAWDRACVVQCLDASTLSRCSCVFGYEHHGMWPVGITLTGTGKLVIAHNMHNTGGVLTCSYDQKGVHECVRHPDLPLNLDGGMAVADGHLYMAYTNHSSADLSERAGIIICEDAEEVRPTSCRFSSGKISALGGVIGLAVHDGLLYAPQHVKAQEISVCTSVTDVDVDGCTTVHSYDELNRLAFRAPTGITVLPASGPTV